MKKTNFNQTGGQPIKGGEGYTATAVSHISNKDYIESSISNNNAIKNIDNTKLNNIDNTKLNNIDNTKLKNIDNTKLNNFINLMNSNKPKNININELLKK
jgi:hypothetical protein